MDAVGLNVICMHFETKLLNSCVLFKPALQYKKCPTFTPSLTPTYYGHLLCKKSTHIKWIVPIRRVSVITNRMPKSSKKK